MVESNAPVRVEEPDISKAYYGTLHGQPQVFELDWDATVPFYVGLTVPDLPGIPTDVSATLLDPAYPNTPVATLAGKSVAWEPFFEAYGRQKYLKGPEFRHQLPAGHYEIRVEGPSPERVFVLAIGERESFPPRELVKDFAILPRITQQYFHRPAYTAFFTPFLGVPIVLALGLLAAVIALAKRVLRRKPALR